MAQIEVGATSTGLPTITGHLEFLDDYTGKTVSVEVKLRQTIFSSGKTGYLMYSGRVAKEPESNIEFRLFNGMIGVYDAQNPTKLQDKIPQEIKDSIEERRRKKEEAQK